MTIKEALQSVVKESKSPYAITYAQAALELGGSENVVLVSNEEGSFLGVAHEKTGKMMIDKELKVQILYVLNNLQSWRGERAREVKTFLKQVSK